MDNWRWFILVFCFFYGILIISFFVIVKKKRVIKTIYAVLAGLLLLAFLLGISPNLFTERLADNRALAMMVVLIAIIPWSRFLSNMKAGKIKYWIYSLTFILVLLLVILVAATNYIDPISMSDSQMVFFMTYCMVENLAVYVGICISVIPSILYFYKEYLK